MKSIHSPFRFYPWLLTILLAAPLESAIAGLQPRTDINPALLYWQAFALFPQATNATEKKFLDQPPKLEKDEGTRIARSYNTAFKLIRRAARMEEPCDWGTDLADGSEAYMPNLAKCRQAVHVGTSRAHFALLNEQGGEAIDDLAACVSLGRNTGRDGTLVGLMVGIAIEGRVAEFVAEHFGAFTPKELSSLSKQIANAPPRGTVRESMETEKAAFLDWFIAKVESFRSETPADESRIMVQIENLFRNSLGGGSKSGDAVEEMIAAAGGNSSGVLAYLRDAEPVYRDMTKIVDAPPANLAEVAREFEESTQNHPNLLVRLIIPAVGKARRRELEALTSFAMLQAAIAYRTGGEAARNAISDPLSKGPFQFETHGTGGEAGFELRSEFNEKGFKARMKFAGKELDAAP